MRPRILITGANGHIGRRLIPRLEAQYDLRVVVRPARVRQMRDEFSVETRGVDCRDGEALFEALDGCSHVVHLVGIIKEGSTSTYADAHEATSRALSEAAARRGIQRIVYLSILGASASVSNACLASKGRAESTLLQGATPALVLRVPMVLGEDDHATHALARRARVPVSFTFRAACREQPIFSDDLLDAIDAGLRAPGLDNVVLDLAGPESLTRRALVQRAAAAVGRRTHARGVRAVCVRASDRADNGLAAQGPGRDVRNARRVGSRRRR